MVDVVCIGHMTMDDIVLSTGETHMGTPGGAATYSASGAAFWRNRHDVGIVSRLGSDYTEEMVRPIATHPAIDMTGVEHMRAHGIGLWLIYDADGYRHWILKHTSIPYEEGTPDAAKIPLSYLETARGYHFAILPLPQLPPLLERIPEGRIVQLDPHYDWFFPKYRSLWDRVLARVTIIMPSEDELCKFFNIDIQEDALAYKPYLVELSEKGPKYVVAKLGSRGAMMYHAETGKFYLVPPYQDTLVDVTGAGDSFCGSFIANFVRSNDAFLALLCGMVGASITLDHLTAVDNYCVPFGEAAKRLAMFEGRIGSREKWEI